MKIFDGIKENLGMTPVDQEEEVVQEKRTKAPEPQADDVDEVNEKPAKKPVRITNVDDLVAILEKKGYSVERRDLQDKNQQPEAQPTQPSQPSQASQPAQPAQPSPQPEFVPAADTAPVVYQNRHLGVRIVQDGEFYNKLANGAYEFDRLFGHGETKLDPTIVAWIGSLYPDVPELAEDFVKNRLRSTLEKNPSLITEVKKIARETTEVTVPYALTFVSKMDGTEFEDRKDAEAALAPYEKIGATMKTAFAKRYRKRHFDGTLGEIVDPSEVYNFAKNYDGNLEKLCRELALNPDKVSGTSDPSTGSNTASD